MSVLRTEGVTKVYGGREVVKGVNLKVPQGEVVGLLGPNGAGKTTTFYTIVGLIRPNQGGIFLNGEEVTHLPVHLRARKGIGYLSQEPSVFRKLSVEENILAILETLPLSRKEREEKLEEHLEELKITHLAQQRASTLSGGERRRVEIARALVTNPSFLLLDEPFTGVDPIVKGEIQGIVRGLKRRGIGILITDHNVRETLEITDRAYIIYEGKILFSGTAQELIHDSKAREVYLGKDFKM
ncbi:LPS export ABC transporter ATP-binding protein [candidate division TA06 bacterium]|nr:LPS export ABC transporter ATP-binding protein [candidate division TA06 bacterium]